MLYAEQFKWQVDSILIQAGSLAGSSRGHLFQ